MLRTSAVRSISYFLTPHAAVPTSLCSWHTQFRSRFTHHYYLGDTFQRQIRIEEVRSHSHFTSVCCAWRMISCFDGRQPALFTFVNRWTTFSSSHATVSIYMIKPKNNIQLAGFAAKQSDRAHTCTQKTVLNKFPLNPAVKLLQSNCNFCHF